MGIACKAARNSQPEVELRRCFDTIGALRWPVFRIRSTMAFNQLPKQTTGVQWLQRSLARGRLGHAYLFAGQDLDELEALARTLAKTLNCLQPIRTDNRPVDSCDVCPNCRRVDGETHPDIHWVRPESKSRIVTVEQMRELMREIQLKPTEAQFKVAIIVGADRLNVQAGNAFLKTLEEPPANSVMILISTEPQRVLETLQSRCLRLNFSGETNRPLDAAMSSWLARFSELASSGQKSLMGRYRLLDVLLEQLGEIRAKVDERLTARSPLQRYDDAEKDLQEKWEDELAAAVEAEYRRRRAELLSVVHRWMRDIWLHTLSAGTGLIDFPDVPGAETVGRRITPGQAMENLQTLEQTQRLLHTNVQEALALEVGLLKLHF